MHGLAVALAVLLASSSGPQELIARVESAPKDVEAFIVRRTGCNHFLGEPPFSRERAVFLEQQIDKLRCVDLDRDEKALRRAYRDDPTVLQLLDETADMGPW